MAKGKEKSNKAIRDGKLLAILQDEEASDREKQRAFDKLYSLYNRQLLTYFLQHGQQGDVAEDLLLKTFMKIHVNIENYDEEKAVFSTWMYTIASNTLKDEVRSQNQDMLSLDKISTKTSEDNDGMEFQLESDHLNPEEIYFNKEKLEKVEEAIDLIDNPVTRQLMRHRFIDDMSFEMIAEKMGIKNSSTLRVTIHREIDSLAEKLEFLREEEG